MPHRNHEFIFSATINYRNSDNQLRPGGPENTVESVVRTALTETLPQDLNAIFGLSVSVEIKGIRPGSIVVFFSAVIGGLGILSRYKSLYDSIELIRQQADRVLDAVLNSNTYSVSVSAVHPNPETARRWFRRRFDHPFAEDFADSAFNQPYSNARDGFFWFLLVLTIIETFVIGLLVYRAVWKTYFGT